MDATPLFRLFAALRRRQIAAQIPAVTQEALLLRLLEKAAGTRFGRDHGFAGIRSVTGFQRAVPLRSYDSFWRDYWQPEFPVLENVSWPGPIPHFAVSSGTTSGRTKYIPLTGAMRRANRKAGLDMLAAHLAARPKSHAFAGKSFMLGGSTVLKREAEGVASGDISGILAGSMPGWASPFLFPPADLARLTDWEEKTARIAEAALDTDIRILGGTPSWLLLFLEKLSALRVARGEPAEPALPHLELLVHGGVDFRPYRHRFEAIVAQTGAELREVYPASEGFIAYADRGTGEGLRLCLDHGLFYEFVPLEELDSPNPTRHWIANAEIGVNYALVLSSAAGLWSYVIGDTVRFVDLDPPRLLVTGRTSYALSAFGEHLIADEVEKAVSTAAGIIGAEITDYAVGAIVPQDGSIGGHLYVVEFDQDVSAADLARFAAAIDRVLIDENEDYEAHRSGDFGMHPPRIAAMPHGRFNAWMKSRGKLGAQNKVPRLIADPDLFANLRRFMGV